MNALKGDIWAYSEGENWHVTCLVVEDTKNYSFDCIEFKALIMDHYIKSFIGEVDIMVVHEDYMSGWRKLA